MLIYMHSGNRLSEMKIGALLSYFSVVLHVIANLFYTPWVIQQIGVREYGLYTLAMAFLGYFLIDFGLSNSVSRFISKYRAEKDEQKIYNFLGLLFKLYAVLSIILLIILVGIFCFIENIFIKLTPDEIAKFKIVFLIVSIYSFASFPFQPLNGILISYEKFIALRLCDVLNKVLTIGLVVLVLLYGQGLYALVIVNAVVGVAVIIIKIMIIKSKINIKMNLDYWDRGFIKEIFSFSIWIVVIVAAQQLLYDITPTILGAVSGTIAITVFSVGRLISTFTWSFANALNGLFMSKVARISLTENRSEATERLMIRVGRIQLIVLGLFIVGFISMGKEFIVLWMGPELVDSYYVAAILILPDAITHTQEIANTELYILNKVKYRASILIGCSILSAAFSLLTAPYWGAIGSAIGIFLGLMLGPVIGMNIVYYKVLHINILRFFRECHVSMAVPLLVTLMIGFVFQDMIPVGSLRLFIAKACLLALLYFSLVWFVSLKKCEKEEIRCILRI